MICPAYDSAMAEEFRVDRIEVPDDNGTRTAAKITVGDRRQDIETGDGRTFVVEPPDSDSTFKPTGEGSFRRVVVRDSEHRDWTIWFRTDDDLQRFVQAIQRAGWGRVFDAPSQRP